MAGNILCPSNFVLQLLYMVLIQYSVKVALECLEYLCSLEFTQKHRELQGTDQTYQDEEEEQTPNTDTRKVLVATISSRLHGADNKVPCLYESR